VPQCGVVCNAHWGERAALSLASLDLDLATPHALACSHAHARTHTRTLQVGPTTDPGELVQLLRVLWPAPAAQRGKVAIITRLGAGAVRCTLPAIIRAVQDARLGAPVVWTCDPMHGNTRVTSTGIKTRDFDDILAELRETFEVHRELGSRLGGCHVELTGENVTGERGGGRGGGRGCALDDLHGSS